MEHRGSPLLLALPFMLLAPPRVCRAQPAINWQHMNSSMYNAAGSHLDVRGEDELYVLEIGNVPIHKLVRLDRHTGDTVWTAPVDTLELNYGMKVIGTDGVMVGGANPEYYDLARLDTSGTLVWHGRVPIGSAVSPVTGGFVCDADENTYIAYFEGPNSTYWHTKVAKYSPDGDLLWVYEYLPAEMRENTPKQIRLDPEGNIVVGGTREFQGQPYDSKAYVLKLDPDGGYLWDRNYVGDLTNNWVHDMWVRDNGRIVITVTDSGYDNNGVSTEGGSVVAYSSEGTQLWAYVAAAGVKPKVIVQNEWSDTYHVLATGSGTYALWLFHFSPTGTLLANAPLAFAGGPRDAIGLAEDRILVSYIKYVPPWEDTHFIVMDPDGTVVWDLPYVHSCLDCLEPSRPWTCIATDPSHVYTAGSKYYNGNERPIALEISIPCVPEVGYCLGQQLADTLSISTQAWAGEVTGDAYTDMLTTFSFDQELLVHANTNGQFALQQTVPLAHMGGPIRTADLNGDGWNDVIVAEDIGNHVTLLENNGGTLSYAGDVDAGFPIGQMELGEADGMNGPDLFVRYFAGPVQEVHVFLNDGSGMFATQPNVLTLPFVAGSMSVGDVDQDGLSDLAVIGQGDGKLYHALGGGAYGAASDIPFNGSMVEVRDVNDDGWRDVVTSGNSMATVGMNQGGSLFQDEVWDLPGLGYRGVPHPFPGDSTVRFFLPDLSDEEVGLDVWSDCVADFSMFALASSAQSTLFATDLTGDAIADLVAFRMDIGQLLVWPNCDQGPPLGVDVPIRASHHSAIIVYPNPSRDAVNIRCPEGTQDLSIMDALRRTVMRRPIAGHAPVSLALDGWARGTYWVVAHGTTGSHTSILVLTE
jgi:hypothetical protein